ERVNLTGTVVINRQGEGDLSNISVTVEGEDQVVTTDEDGKFSITLEKTETYNLLATRDDLATTKVQGLHIDKEDPIEDIKILIKEPYSDAEVSGYDKTPPHLEVSGIKNMSELSAEERVDLQSDKPIYLYYVALNESIITEKAENTDGKKDLGSIPVQFPLNYGGDMAQVIVTVMDNNNNITQKIYQQKMPEAKEGNQLGAVQGLKLIAQTYNNSTNLIDGSELGIAKVEEDTILLANLDWPVVETATSYNVYRSRNGEDYTYVDTVFKPSFTDIDSSLNVGEKVWYKVAAVNENGEGVYSPEAYVIPLPTYKLSLKGPGSQDVSIVPDLSWESNELGVDNLEYKYVVLIRDTNSDVSDPSATSFEFKSRENITEVNIYDNPFGFNLILARGIRYEWGFLEAKARKIYIEAENVYSEAITIGAEDEFVVPDNSAMKFETKK
ncbi:MAG: carboxypeptidase-like regulatory domain-containing protein, partial [Halanaerobacter sp.]